ncbi:PREDICTED: taste receptor type 2 member 9-like [Acanthisitta chloris]|uniref:taste receptor type 2 member 9-like n=1 Tax=Acanthisitta chloris TaxID=57068 RepID=UPI0004F0EAC7|nr:PREDICTED: taste receptor type 2 member 9-like [Acanthisitta chloris]
MEACHSTEQSNGTSYSIVAVAIITLETFAGLWINAFIVSVLCIAWVKEKSLNSSEKILLLLGWFRFWFLCILWVHSFLSMIYPNYLYVHPILQIIEGAGSFSNYSNLWVSASLCVFYCIKIANFRNSFFIYLKVKIDRIVPWLVFSALLLLFSLWRHKRMMQTNSMKNLSMDAHIKAMKSILSFFIIYSINFIFLILTLIYSINVQNEVLLIIDAFLPAFPGIHSLILIFSNPKLERILLRILFSVECKVCMR